jgi:putative ABC transport system permease protein
MASPRYFEVMRIPILRGRAFAEQDAENATPVAAVSEAFANRHFPGQDPLGKRVRLQPSRRRPDPPWLTIVGVVRDVKSERLELEDHPLLYEPLFQDSTLAASLLVRTRGREAELAQAVRREVRAVDPEQPIHAVRALREVVARTMSQRRFATTLLGVFALMALVLAAVGTYAVTAHSVSRRTAEIGLRMALGARSIDVLALVLRQAMGHALCGVGLGLLGAAGLSRALSGLLFGISPSDPVSFGGIAGLLAGTTLAACYFPASRAAAVDPLVALRSDAE